MSEIESKHITETPILLINFNRPDRTRELIEILKEFKPKNIYYAVDGARNSKPGEIEKVKQVQQLVNELNWDCTIHTKFNEENLGCKWGPITAIDWIFQHEEQAIILEDDIRPNSSFFYFCDQLLEEYKNNQKVFFIGGNNSLNDHPRKESYRFSSILYVWGWATWRRAWLEYEPDIQNWQKEIGLRGIKKHFRCNWIEAFILGYLLFDMVGKNRIEAWDYQLIYFSILNNKLGAVSNVNLTENKGFGRDSTHTRITPNFLLPAEKIKFPLVHPTLARDIEGDLWMLKNAYGLVSYKRYLLNLAKILLVKIRSKFDIPKKATESK